MMRFVGGGAHHHLAKKRPRIESVQLRRPDQAAEGGGAFTAAIRSPANRFIGLVDVFAPESLSR